MSEHEANAATREILGTDVDLGPGRIEVVHVPLREGDLVRVCGGGRGIGLLGKVVRRYADGRCVVKLPPGSNYGDYDLVVDDDHLELVGRSVKGRDIAADRIEVDLPNGWTPFVAGEHCKPDYYRQVRRHPLIDENVDVEDMLYVFVDCPRIAEAIRHLIRAGRKPGEPRAKDISKAMEFLQRELSFEAMQREEGLDEMDRAGKAAAEAIARAHEAGEDLFGTQGRDCES